MVKSLRITCVIGSLQSGGAERSMVRLTEMLTGLGHQVTLLTLAPTAGDHFPVSDEVVRVVAPPQVAQDCRWYNWGCWRKKFQALREAIEATRPQLVISYLDTLNIMVLLSMRGSRIPVVVSERTDPRQHFIKARWKFLRKFLYPKADCVVMVARESLDWAKTQWPTWPAVSIPNPVVPLAPSPGAVRPEWFGEHNLIAMGRLGPEKGFDLLLDAFSPLAPEYPGWHLTILGEGPERESLSQKTNRMGISRQVHLPGQVKNPQDFLPFADIYVLSSRYEGFPNALAEAMACGLPAVSFDCESGPSQIIRHEVDGLLVPPQNVAALRQALEKLMGDPLLRNSFGAKAPDILRRYNPQTIAALWRQMIDTLNVHPTGSR